MHTDVKILSHIRRSNQAILGVQRKINMPYSVGLYSQTTWMVHYGKSINIKSIY